MTDFIMLGTLAVCVGLIYLLISWCGKQVDKSE